MTLAQKPASRENPRLFPPPPPASFAKVSRSKSRFSPSAFSFIIPLLLLFQFEGEQKRGLNRTMKAMKNIGFTFQSINKKIATTLRLCKQTDIFLSIASCRFCAENPELNHRSAKIKFIVTSPSSSMFKAPLAPPFNISH